MSARNNQFQLKNCRSLKISSWRLSHLGKFNSARLNASSLTIFHDEFWNRIITNVSYITLVYSTETSARRDELVVQDYDYRHRRPCSTT